MLLAIDPGLRSPGVALFDAKGLRVAHALEMGDAWLGEAPGARWLKVANEIVAWAINFGCFVPPETIVFECPKWYSRDKSKGDPNQLVGIAGVAACVVGRLQPREVKSPHPDEWIGQLSKICPTCHGRKTTPTKNAGVEFRGRVFRPKRVKLECPDCHGSAWQTPRGRYILPRLTQDETLRCPDQNDAIDAVGIGLWALGRLSPRRVFSNGRDGR